MAAPPVTPRGRDAPARIGVVVYDGVEPIDVAGTVGVISMARRLLPALEDAVIAREAGRVRLAGGLVIDVPHGVADAPACEIVVVCGGPGWPQAASDPALLAYLRRLPDAGKASVCTGALILAASGALAGRTATTRRAKIAPEPRSPLDLLAEAVVAAPVRAVVDDGVVTSGGVSLAIDGTLYLLGKLYGPDARDDVARLIEYDRAYAANAGALGIERVDTARAGR